MPTKPNPLSDRLLYNNYHSYNLQLTSLALKVAFYLFLYIWLLRAGFALLLWLRTHLQTGDQIFYLSVGHRTFDGDVVFEYDVAIVVFFLFEA